MLVTVTPQLSKGDRVPVYGPGPSSGFIRVGREPGGRLREWARTAMLFREAHGENLELQLHAVKLAAWDDAGVWLSGVERHWRRKDCTEYPQLWLVSFAESHRVEVYFMRSRGERIPVDQVRRSTPLRGQIEAAIEGRTREPRVALRAAVAGGDVELEGARLQRWDSRGLVLAGLEARGHGRRGDDAWQSWFVRFPGPWTTHDAAERSESFAAA